MPRSIKEITKEIVLDWKNISFYAKPYIKAMATMDNIQDKYWFDSGQEVLLHFLINARSWRGETARRIKKELNQILKENS